MAFPDFHNHTFVAFCDISGFKQLMSRDAEKAVELLRKFYSDAYGILERTKERGHTPVYGLLVSDCAILVAENQDGITNPVAFKALLSTVKRFNKKSLQHGLMLTTSIVYGPFDYEQRSEGFGIEKNMITGAAYIEAYKDSNSTKPKLKCGECRIVIEGLPGDVVDEIDDGDFPMLKKDRGHYYYYWMRENPEEIEDFNKAYESTEDLKYLGMRLVLQGNKTIDVIGDGEEND